MPAFPLADQETNELVLDNFTASSELTARESEIKVIAYPASNSLLVKGTVSQVEYVETLVRALDVPKRHIELSLWIIDIEKRDLEHLGADWSGGVKIGNSLGMSFNESASFSTLDGARFIAAVQALEQKKRATVVSRPVVLTQENIPAIFDNNRTFYTKLVGERVTSLEEVTYGTMVSVLPRFGNANQIELLLNIEDGNESDTGENKTDNLPQVGRTLISTIARVPQGKSLLIGGYTRDSNHAERRKIPLLGDIPLIGALFSYRMTDSDNVVRVFLIQPREIAEEQMQEASAVLDDTRTLNLQTKTTWDISDQMLQKWVDVYLNRNKKEMRYGH